MPKKKPEPDVITTDEVTYEYLCNKFGSKIGTEIKMRIVKNRDKKEDEQT